MKLNSNQEIIRYLHRHYYPIHRLSKARLQEAEDLSRIFKLKKNERLELSIKDKGDYFYIITGCVQVLVNDMEKQIIHAPEMMGKSIDIPETDTTIQFKVLEDCILYHIENDVIEHLLSWDGIVASHSYEIHPNLSESIDHIRHSLAFQRLPLECVIGAFKSMKKIDVKKGDEIIRQGEQGERFYLIKSGRAEVWVLEEFEDEPEKVNELGKNESFGEQALLAEQPRSATVRMIEDGELLALEKQDFLKFFSQTMVREVDINVAKAMIDGGYQLIDVRFEEEYEALYIPEATLIPLNVFREGMENLSKDKQYVIHCRSGKRSRVAALLMSELGFDVVSMRGGIIQWPFEKKGLSVRKGSIQNKYK
ncbi:MAG TPA: cyclic nucleotide-binding domain-containing protein [Thiotrichaceae bacterium]|nr:cyclic nucleotide-binding domain-containing protein [Thiotrichaceae bacterium]